MTGKRFGNSAAGAVAGDVRDRVEAYIRETLAVLQAPDVHPSSLSADPHETASRVFDILTSRRFSALSRKRTAPFHEAVCDQFALRIRRGEPLRFYYDIGPGYHASLAPGDLPLGFAPGLSELLILTQVARFSDRVREIYPPGAHFHLVIDNLCGLATNGIPVSDTGGYVARLRELVKQTGMNDLVELTVESELFDASDYQLRSEDVRQHAATIEASPADIANVERFLGRRASAQEAAERMARYILATAVTERLLAEVVDGVRMTQRASQATLGFRPFPGGDSRTQCGVVALTESGPQKLRPVLLTSQNIGGFGTTSLSYPELLPAVAGSVTFATPLAAS